MMLAQFASDTEYFEFFRERIKEGKVVILDNGAYENSLVNPEELIRIANELKPTFLVAPDELGDGKATDMLWKYFNPLFFATAKSMTKLMYVLQTREEGLLEMTERFANCNAPAIALPRNLGADRALILQHVRRMLLNRSPVYIHALGCWDESLTECTQLTRFGVNSMDSKLSYKAEESVSSFRFKPDAFVRNSYKIFAHIDQVDKACHPSE